MLAAVAALEGLLQVSEQKEHGLVCALSCSHTCSVVQLIFLRPPPPHGRAQKTVEISDEETACTADDMSDVSFVTSTTSFVSTTLPPSFSPIHLPG